MATIKSLQAKEILDAQGDPTIHVTLQLDSGEVVETSVPNSNIQYPAEAKKLLDQDPKHMAGKGVKRAVALINQTLAEKLIGQDPTQQQTIDQLLIQLDGTNDKSQAGANTLLALSQVVMKAGAAANNLPLYEYLVQQHQLTEHASIPTCLYGLVNGGQYGASNLDFQEFLVIPASHSDYRVSLEIESALGDNLQQILKDQGANYATGSLGGFTPFLQKNSDVFEFIVEAARKTSFILARDFFFGVDVGGEQLFDKGKYLLKDKSTGYTEKEFIEYYKNLQQQYSINYFEDPFTSKDAQSWQSFTNDLGQTTKIASDVTTATHPKMVQQVIKNQQGNTLVVKPSQIGTLTEALEAVRMAKEAGWSIVVSQQTGETNDDFLADFAVGIGADFVKFGPTNRGEAVAKYNRLADIYLALEQVTREGAVMPQPNQQPNADATNAAQDNTQPAGGVQPTADNNQPAGAAQAADTLPKPADAPAEPPPAAASTPPATTPADGGQATPGADQPKAEAALPGAPQNTSIPEAAAPTPPVAPITGADGNQPAAKEPTKQAMNQPVSLGKDQAAGNVQQPPQPAAPASQSAAEQDATNATTQSEPPINTPPAAAPTAPKTDGGQPLETDVQKTIDSTLQEIGAQPGNTQAAPSQEQASQTPQTPEEGGGDTSTKADSPQK